MAWYSFIGHAVTFYFICSSYAAAPDRPTGSIAVSGTTISSTAYNNDLNTLYTYVQNGVSVYSDGSIVNIDIATNGAIAYSKLSLTDSIGNADINSSAGIVDTKLGTITTANKVSTTSIFGSLQKSLFNSGTNASSSTFWRGDLTWNSVSTGSIFYSASGTYIAPQHINRVYITMCGGGGGAGGTDGTGGSGGGGGECVINFPVAVTPGGSTTVTVGAGGAGGTGGGGGTAGAAGSNTSFGSVSVAAGTGGGFNGAAAGTGGVTTATRDASGSTAGSRLQFDGGNGAVGSAGNGGGGGGTILGAGGAGVASGAANSAAANTGAGGGGGGGDSANGGNGGSGFVIVGF